MGSGSTTRNEGQQNMTDEPVSLTNRRLEILALVAEGATDMAKARSPSSQARSGSRSPVPVL